MSWQKLARSLLSLMLSISLVLPGCTRPPDTDQTEQYRFDKAGRLCLRIAPDGGKTEYIYNQDGLPVEIRYPGGWVKYGYDADGRRIWMQDETGVTEYYYDALHRPIGIAWKHGADKLLIYDYDGRGNLSYVGVGDLTRISREVKYRDLLKDLVGKKPEQVSNWGAKEQAYGKLVENLKAESPEAKKAWLEHEVGYHYDMYQRLTVVNTPQGRVTYGYDPEKGQVRRLLPNGITSTFTYTPDGSLKSLQHEGPDKGLIARYQYDFNQAGKVVTAREATPQDTKTTGYVWDNRGYLREVRLPDGGKVRYDYDAMGNRTLKEDAAGVIHYTYDKFGRLSQAGPEKYRWDVNGNQIAQTGGPHQTRITYDGRNLPVTAKTTEGMGKYRWDGDGNLVFRQDKAAGRYYLPDPLAPPGRTLAEFDKSGKSTNAYMSVDGLIAKKDVNGKTVYFLEDGLNVIRYSADAHGKILGQRDYQPYVGLIKDSGEVTTNHTTTKDIYLPELRMEIKNGRPYDIQTGRYLTPDNVSVDVKRANSFNKYADDPQKTVSENIAPLNKSTMYVSVYDYNRVMPAWYDIKGRFQFMRDWAWEYAKGQAQLGDKGHWGRGLVLSTLAEGLYVFGSGLWIGEQNFVESFAPGVSAGTRIKAGLAFGWELIGFTGGVAKLLKINSGLQNLGSVQLMGYEAFVKPNMGALISRGTLMGLNQTLLYGERAAGMYSMWGWINTATAPEGPISKSFTQAQAGKGSDRAGAGGGGVKADPPKPVLEAREGKSLLKDRYKFEDRGAPPPPPGGGGAGVGKLKPGPEAKGGPPPPPPPPPPPGGGKGAVGGEKQKPTPEIKIEKSLVKKADDSIFRGGPPPPGGGGPPPPPALIGGGDLRKPFRGPDPPDKGGGGAMAGFRDPFKGVEAKLGGIKLAAAGKMLGDVGAIKGAVFDPEKQCLVLLGDQEVAAPQLKPEDLAVALLCVYGPQPQDPTFSLDPADPKNPDGPWLKAVYRPYDLTAGTEFGNALFEADWLLKQYSFGVKVDQEGKKSERKSAVPGFKNSAELSLEERFSGSEKRDRARLWIESDDIRLKRAGNGIYFDRATMRVKAKKQVVDPKSPTGLSDVETTGDFRAVKFANQFTRLYDDIAKESPEFERVRQLAKAVALAKWMKEQGIKVDMAWVAEYANKRVPMVEKAPRLSATYEQRQETPFTEGNRRGVRTSIRTVTISGGVKLQVEPKFIPDDGPARALQQEVKQVLQRKDPPPVFSVKHNGQDLKGWVLPVNKVGQDLWKNYRAGQEDGIVYQFDKQQNVVKSDDKQGNVAVFEYDAQNRLKKVVETRKDGFKVAGEKNDTGSCWSLETPRGHKLQYAYSVAGLLKEVQMDGKKVADYDINETKKEWTVHLKDCQERLIYDDRNQLKEIEFKPTNGDPAAGRAGQLSFDYNQAGNLSRIAGTGLTPIQIAYGPDGDKPVRISTPEGNTGYDYYPDGRLKAITDPGGATTRFTYDGQELANLQVNYQGVHAEYRFTKDGLARSQDLLGGVTEYGYAQGRLVSVKQGQYREAKYTYDDRGRLKEIILPDGSRTEYRYGEEEPRKGKKPEAEMTLVVVTHPAPGPGGVSR